MAKRTKYKTFCTYHIKCKDIDDGKPGTACAAHLAEGHVFTCPYDSLEEAKNRRGGSCCEDAEAPPERE